MMVWKMFLLFQGFILRFHVNLARCTTIFGNPQISPICIFVDASASRTWIKTKSVERLLGIHPPKNASLTSDPTSAKGFQQETAWLFVVYRGIMGNISTTYLFIIYRDYSKPLYYDPYEPTRIHWNVMTVLNVALFGFHWLTTFFCDFDAHVFDPMRCVPFFFQRKWIWKMATFCIPRGIF